MPKTLPKKSGDILNDLGNVIDEWHNVREFKRLWRENQGKWLSNEQVAKIFRDLAWQIFADLNAVRGEDDCGLSSYEKFVEGCYYRDILHENYEIAKEEWFNLLFGWW